MQTTLVKIDAEDRDIVARTLIELDVKHNFYTVEANPLLLMVEIGHTNPAILWDLGKLVGMKISNRIFQR